MTVDRAAPSASAPPTNSRDESAHAFAYDYDAGFDDPLNKNAWFGRIIGRDRRVLEVGCATGYVGEYLVREQGCSVVGVEIVESAAERSRTRGCYDEILIGDIMDPATVAPLAPGSFDFVTFGDVLEHLTNPGKALEAVAPLLKPGGQILICVPSIVHWSTRLKITLGRFEYTDTGPMDRTHVHFFTPKTARDLVRQGGFEVVEEGGVVWLPRHFHHLPVGLRRSLERFAGKVAPNLAWGQVLLCIRKPAGAR